MRVLVLNCGSSSIKSAVVDTVSERRALAMRVLDIGEASCRLHADDAEIDLGARATFETAAHVLLTQLRRHMTEPVSAVAHRLVHGGARFVEPTLIDQRFLEAVDELSALAPLHNPPAMAAIRMARELLPDSPHIAVFDTAFHATLPAHARDYALPADIAARQGIRRYGFHGASHAHVASAVARQLSTTAQELRIVSCHLGNGASVAAIERGRSVETSMGMTPMEGLIMGTRAGDIDPGVLLRLLQTREVDVDALDELLNKRSGLLGLTGTNDMREVERRAAEGESNCLAAIDLYVHRVRKYIGAYAAVMGGVDAIAYTGGIGENSALIRQRCSERLEYLGASLDEAANRDQELAAGGGVALISATSSRVQLVVVRADEELTIARAAAHLLGSEARAGAESHPLLRPPGEG